MINDFQVFTILDGGDPWFCVTWKSSTGCCQQCHFIDSNVSKESIPNHCLKYDLYKMK